MKKIIMILSNSYNPDVRVYQEAKYLVEKGFDVEILCWDRESNYPNEETQIKEGIKIKRFYPKAVYGSGIKQIVPYLKFIREVKKYLSDKDFNYIHCHDLDGAIVGNALKKDNVKLIFDMHEYYEFQVSNRKIKRIVHTIVNRVQTSFDFIIYVNSDQIKKIKKNNLSKIIYLPNYPKVTRYKGFVKEDSHSLRVSYIGSVRQYNELKNLIEVAKEKDDIAVAIHGEGIAYKRLKKYAEDIQNVDVTGVYKYDQAGQLYNECDVLYAVYPTDTIQTRNGYPVKYFEAIASKTPIIVSKGTVLEEEVIKNDIGFVVDGKNARELEELLSYINKNREVLKVKVDNIEKIQNTYQWETVVKNLDKIYSI